MGAAVGSLFGYGIPRMHLNLISKDINKRLPDKTGWRKVEMDLGLGLGFSENLASPLPMLCLRF